MTLATEPLDRDIVTRKLEKYNMRLEPLMPSADPFVPWTVAMEGPCYDLIAISARPPIKDGKVQDEFKGKIPTDLNVDQARSVATYAAAGVMSVIDDACGQDWGRVVQLVHITGYLNTTPEFDEHKSVLNAASIFFREMMGEAGIHVRSVTGCHSQPMNIAVLIDAMVRIRPR
jgi:hypothetical protein